MYVGASGYTTPHDCCPPGSLPKGASCVGEGDILATGDLSIYATKHRTKKTNAVAIVFHDLHGFEGGRQRPMCDKLSQNLNIPVYMPDLFNGKTPPGDRDDNIAVLAPTILYNLIFNSRFGPEKMQDNVKRTVDFIHKEHGTEVHFVLIGLCFGFWVAANNIPRNTVALVS